jgi:hypothetical protein
MDMKIVINRYIDLVWEYDKPVIYVAGKEFLQCAFLAVTVPASDLGEIDSVDRMTSVEGSRSLEGTRDIDAYLHRVGNLEPGEHMTPEAIMQAHASNLIAWVENDYNTRILDSNLSFPLLKALARAGDQKARRILQPEIIDRLKEDFAPTSIAIVYTCGDVMDDTAFLMAAKSKNPLVREAMADDEDNVIPAKMLDILANDPDVEVRRSVAAHDRALPSTLDRLALDKSADVRSNVAENTNTSTSALEKLAKDEGSETREYVAANLHTPSSVLDLLANDEDEDVRDTLSSNDHVSPATLVKLSMDEKPVVRYRVAGNVNTPPDVLDRLANDRNKTVVWNVARNNNTSTSTKIRIAEDPNMPIDTRAEAEKSLIRRGVKTR